MKKLFVILVLALLGQYSLRLRRKTPPSPRPIPFPVPPGLGAQMVTILGVDLKEPSAFSLRQREENPRWKFSICKRTNTFACLTDFKEPHNVLPLPEMNKIYVVDGRGPRKSRVLDYEIVSVGWITFR